MTGNSNPLTPRQNKSDLKLVSENETHFGAGDILWDTHFAQTAQRTTTVK